MLAEAIDNQSPVVIAVAGGVVLSESNRALLVRSGVVVWLRASIETLSERVEHGGARPRLGADPARSLRELYLARHPLYAVGRRVRDRRRRPGTRRGRRANTSPSTGLVADQ